MEINDLIKSINKKYGNNIMRKGSDILKQADFRIPTGSIALDVAIGGGIPSGRMTAVAGDYSVGKSLLGYKIISNVQKMFKQEVDGVEVISNEGTPLRAALILLETGSFSDVWARQQGVDTDELILVQPDGLESALNVIVALQEAGVELIVVDSYTALVPTKTLESEFGDSQQMGIKAKMLSDFHNKYQALNNKLNREGKIPTTLFSINQLKDSIGLYAKPFIPGGKSITYTASLIIHLRRGDILTEGTGDNKRTVGKFTKFKIDKSKVSVPNKTGEFILYTDDYDGHYAGEYDNEYSLVQMAIDYGIVDRRGAWMYYEGEQVAQGKDALMRKLKENQPLFNEIKAKVEKAYKDSLIGGD